MKFVYPEINNVFTVSSQYMNSIIIENQKSFRDLINDINAQVNGLNGKSVLSVDNTPVIFSKNAELITNFIDFDINRKTIQNKILQSLENVAIDAEHYADTCQLLANIEKSIYDWSFSLPCNIAVTKMNVINVLKGVGTEICSDYPPAAGQIEKLIDYMELVREFDNDKLFFTVNMRSYFEDELINQFIETVLHHELKVFMIESHACQLLLLEKRWTIDMDLCEF